MDDWLRKTVVLTSAQIFVSRAFGPFNSKAKVKLALLRNSSVS